MLFILNYTGPDTSTPDASTTEPDGPQTTPTTEPDGPQTTPKSDSSDGPQTTVLLGLLGPGKIAFVQCGSHITQIVPRIRFKLKSDLN